MIEILDSVTLKDFIYFIVGTITVLSVVVERVEKFPIKPWSNFFRWIGNCLNRDMNEKLEAIEKQQMANNKAIIELDKKVERKFDEKQKDDDEKESKRLRANIISFADSCRVGNHHTQSHFENIMRDYSDYEHYCKKHDIPNHFIDSEYKYIEKVYQECLEEDKFI